MPPNATKRTYTEDDRNTGETGSWERDETHRANTGPDDPGVVSTNAIAEGSRSP